MGALQATYIFEDILGIRKLREERAFRECAERRALMEQAYIAVEQCRLKLEQFREWRLQERERLYGEVIRHEVIMAVLERLKASLAALDEKETLHIRGLQLAEIQAEEAKSAYEEALRRWRDTRTNLAKMEEHKDIWLEEALEQALYAEELEMEEFGVKKLGGVGEELDY
jgi:hypothetical protein